MSSTFSEKMRNLGARRILLGSGFVAVLLGIGVATYFLGEDSSKPDVKPQVVKMEIPERATRGDHSLVESLTLEWGTGDGEVAVSPQTRRSTLDTVFLGSDGKVFVVDHVPGRIGARVQWFKDGALLGVKHVPGGSTLFTADGDGFMYVIAKGAQSSEQVIVADAKGSTVATYTVPLGLNSGGVVRRGNTLYARAYSSFTDPDADTFEAKDVLVPVAVDGKQLNDRSAEAAVVDAWGWAGDGTQIRTRSAGKARESGEFDTSRYLRYGGSPEVELPASAVVLGASDGEPSVWMMLRPGSLETRGAAGWPAMFDAAGVVLRVGADGKVLSAIPVPLSRIANPLDMGWTARLSVDGSRMAVATADESAVKILIFGRR